MAALVTSAPPTARSRPLAPESARASASRPFRSRKRPGKPVGGLRAVHAVEDPLLSGPVRVHDPDRGLTLQLRVAAVARALEVGDLLPVGRVHGARDARVRPGYRGQHAHAGAVGPHRDERPLTADRDERLSIRRPGNREELGRASPRDVRVVCPVSDEEMRRGEPPVRSLL